MMNGEQKMYSYVWTAAFLAIVCTIFMMSSCVQNSDKLTAPLVAQCMKEHGIWAKVEGSDHTYGCRFIR